MGRRIREHDWSATSLGPVDAWPQPLRWALSICLQSSFPTAIYWGEELRLLYNDAWAPIPGERHPDALGRPAREVWWDIWHVIEPQFREVLDSGQGLSTYDQLLPMRRGAEVEETYWNYSFTPVRDEHGVIVGVFNQGNETTERVLAARQRQREIDRLREWFEQAPGAIAVLEGPHHVFEVANAAYRRLVGEREIIGKPVAQALPEVVGQGFTSLLDEVYLTGEPYIGDSAKVMLQRRVGAPSEERILDFVYYPMRSAAGRVTGVFVQATDVTERAATEQALRESEVALRAADRRKDAFLATLAHELRNPLAPLQSGLDLLRVAGDDAHARHRTVSLMQRQMTHFVRLIDDLLDVSRITQDKLRLEMETCDVRDLLVHALETLAPEDADGRRVSLDVPERALLVRCDRVRLVQVFGNLLSNARKHTLNDGRIGIRVEVQGDQVLIGVRDDGVGLRSDDVEKIFELFYQVADGNQGGLGIGLTLVRDLVHLHGGTVRALSGGIDQGSEFVVTLPRADDLSIGQQALPALDDSATARAAQRVLVVDDNRDAAESLAMLLGVLGATVETAHDGRAALRLVSEFRPRMVLLDIGMPEMSGYDVAAAIRSIPNPGALLLVAVTGWGTEADKARARGAGFDDHLTKPVAAEDLHRLFQALEETPPPD